MKTDIEALAAKLTVVAIAAFGNPRVFVYPCLGVLWLAERRGEDGEDCYTFDSVGVPRQGLRRLQAEVQRIATERPRPA